MVADDLALTQLDARYAQLANNLSDLPSPSTARTSLGLTGAATASLPLSLANGGTGQTSQQAAVDALAGAQTSGQFLRGNGTHVVMAAITAGDVPDLAYVDSVTAADSSVTVTGAADAPSVASVPAQFAQRIFAV